MVDVSKKPPLLSPKKPLIKILETKYAGFNIDPKVSENT